METTYTTEEIITSKEFSNFYQIATSYCEFIETYQEKSKVDFLQQTRQLLLNLYERTLKLQWVDLQSNIDFEEILDDKVFEKTLSSIADRLEDARYYWHVFEPTDHKDTELVCGDLLDDLGDIYKDLKYGIMIYNLGKKDCIENALWEFKFSFDKHWDDHCINALTGIHYYLQNE